MSEESVSAAASQPEPSPTSPGGICAVLAYCGGDAPGTATSRLLSAHREDAAAFEQSLFDNVLLRILTAPHHRPIASAGMLRELAVAIAFVESKPDVRPLRERVAHWLLEANGGSGCGARDTGVRWRTCILLATLLKAAPSTLLGRQANHEEGQGLPPDLSAAASEYLLLHVRDRSADVRLAAVEGLDVIKLKHAGSDQAVAERAMQDCDAYVRAASVRSLALCSDAVPRDVIAHARLDCAPRVRRLLLRALEEKIKSCSVEWKTVWPSIVLSSLGDRSSGVRAAAARCLYAGTVGGWLDPLLSQGRLAEEMAGNLTVAATQILMREPEESRLTEQLLPEPALLAISDGGDSPSVPATVFARVAVGATAASSHAADAAAVLPALMAVLRHGDAVEIRQMLLGCLTAEVPASSSALAELSKAAAAVLLRAPVSDAAQGLLGKGALSPQLLGAAGEAQPHNIQLAMLLLRRVASTTAASQGPLVRRASAQDVCFSKAALSAIRCIRQQLEKAEQSLTQRQQDAESAHHDLEVFRYQRRARFGYTAESSDKNNLERKVDAAEASVASAKKAVDDWNVRVVLAASAWLQYSRMSTHQQAQSLLEDVLRPALRDGAEHGYVLPAAAVMGIAVYASKSKDTALVHWPFFAGVLDVQIKRLHQPAASALSEDAPLCVATRYAEIATLFLCDAVLLHSSAVGEERVGEALLMFARALSALDAGASQVYGLADLMQQLAHLRAVICDRICCLAMMGKLHGSIFQAQWILARFLVDLCGPGMSEVVHPDDASTKVMYAVAGERLLRFMCMLPMTSLAHAELLVSAMESFFAVRMWADVPQGRGSNTRSSPAVRVTRLVCGRLRSASIAVSAGQGDMDADHEQSSTARPERTLHLRYVKMQVRAICATAAALLAAPGPHTPMLRDAFAAGILTSAAGGHPFTWAGEDSDGLAAAAASLLEDWAPATAAKQVETLLAEVRSMERSANAGEVWAQVAVERAADLRLDFQSVGLFDPAKRISETVTGTRRGISRAETAPTATAYSSRPSVAAPAQVATPQRVAEAIRESMPEQLQETHLVKLEWQLVDLATSQSMQVPDGHTITIGRHPLSDIVIDAVVVSGRHCSVTSLPSGLEVQDLGGRNGTYVNDRRLSAESSKMILQAGDVLAIAGQLGPRFEVQQSRVAHAHASEKNAQPKKTQEARPGLLVTKRSFGVLSAEIDLPPKRSKTQEEALFRDESPQRESDVANGNEELLEQGEQSEQAQRKDDEYEEEVGLESMDKRQTESAFPEEVPEPSEHKATPLRQRQDRTGETELMGQDLHSTGTCSLGVTSLTPGKMPLPPRLRSKRKATDAEEEAFRKIHSLVKKAKIGSARSEESGTAPAPTVEDVAEKVVAVLQNRSHTGPCLINLETGSESWLPLQGTIAIGRMQDCQVVVWGPQISARHCILLLNDGDASLEDMSTNGTYINDTRVPKGFALPQQVPLRHGDRISLATCEGPSFLFLAAADLRQEVQCM